MNIVSRFVSLAVVSVDTSASATGTLPVMTHLAAIAMRIAERDAEGEWHFTLERRAVGAGDGEDALLAWAIQTMPPSGIVLGWQLAERIVPPLLHAGTESDADIGRAFLDRFLKLVTAPSIDLAVRHGGAGAPPLSVVVARHGISFNPMTAGDVESAWAFGNVSLLAAQAEAEATATWQLWLAEANGTAGVATTAFARWREI